MRVHKCIFPFYMYILKGNKHLFMSVEFQLGTVSIPELIMVNIKSVVHVKIDENRWQKEGETSSFIHSIAV